MPKGFLNQFLRLLVGRRPCGCQVSAAPSHRGAATIRRFLRSRPPADLRANVGDVLNHGPGVAVGTLPTRRGGAHARDLAAWLPVQTDVTMQSSSTRQCPRPDHPRDCGPWQRQPRRRPARWRDSALHTRGVARLMPLRRACTWCYSKQESHGTKAGAAFPPAAPPPEAGTRILNLQFGEWRPPPCASAATHHRPSSACAEPSWRRQR
jgi:hypothetical protein